MKNYIKEYYDEIKKGNIIAGVWIKLVYEYIISGIKNKKFFLDKKKANKAIDWIETHCFHTEGPLAPGPLKLELWQKALVSVVFGIVDAKGHRQFREVVLIVSRKNGKSLLASAIIKYEFYIDGGYGAKIYCLAPKLDQADIIYSNVWQMVILDPEWQALKLAIDDSIKGHERKTIDDSGLAKRRQSDIYLPETNSAIKKIAFSAKKSDGFNPSLTICDEIASWVGAQGLRQYEVMKSGMGARPEPLLFSCSTAGYEYEGIFDELIKRSTAFLNGNSKETRLLPFLYMSDCIENDMWKDIDELKKSNPNLDVSVTLEYLLEEIAIAEGSLSKKAEFITKYNCRQQNSSQAWLNAVDVEESFGDELRLEDFKDCYAIGGIDLSRTTDLTVCTCIIEKNGILNVFAQFFMPKEKLEEATARDGVPYAQYVKQGWLKLSGDNYVEYHDCVNWFVELVREYQVLPLKIGYDSYSSQYMVQEMKVKFDFHMDDVHQGYNLTPVINEMEGLIKDKKLNFGNNNLLKIHLLNSAIKMDTENNKVKLVKISAKDRIDGCAALLDALCVRQKWWGEIGAQLTNEE